MTVSASSEHSGEASGDRRTGASGGRAIGPAGIRPGTPLGCREDASTSQSRSQLRSQQFREPLDGFFPPRALLPLLQRQLLGIGPITIEEFGLLAREVGITAALFDAPAGGVAADVQMRVHLARAVALGPTLLIAEHPSATLPRDAVAAFGTDLGKVARCRGIALLAITADDSLAKAIGGSRVELVAATGELRASSRIRRLFR